MLQALSKVSLQQTVIEMDWPSCPRTLRYKCKITVWLEEVTSSKRSPIHSLAHPSLSSAVFPQISPNAVSSFFSHVTGRFARILHRSVCLSSSFSSTNSETSSKVLLIHPYKGNDNGIDMGFMGWVSVVGNVCCIPQFSININYYYWKIKKITGKSRPLSTLIKRHMANA